MSDPDTMPDPMDQAYAEAEAVLSDEAARSARRARVLAAVARQGAPDAAVPAAQPRLWRRGGWLVAACVTAMSLFVALQVYRPSAPPTKPPAAPAAPAATTQGSAAAVTPRAPPSPVRAPPAPAPAPLQPSVAAPRAAKAQAEPPLVVAAQSAAPPAPAAPAGGNLKPWPSSSAESAPPPPPPADAASEQAPPVEAGNQPPSPSARAASGAENVTEMVVTAEKRESRRPSIPAAVSAFTGRVRDAFDPGARLRSAAAAGRIADIEALLARGAAVDASDAAGETALMKSIQADQPAAAALLRQHGASLDRQNHAGESARDMARDEGDADLNQALGLSP